jgi:hypothetical protein
MNSKQSAKGHVSIIWPVTSNINIITVAVNAIQRHSDLALNPPADHNPQPQDHCYDRIHQCMYSDLSVCGITGEMVEHRVRSRKTDVRTNQPAGSCRRRLWTAVMSNTLFLFFWWYTLWADNSLTISILTLSKSPKCCRRVCHVAIWREVWNYVQKTVTQPTQFICTHGTLGHTTAHSTQMHTALFQALYSLMSL